MNNANEIQTITADTQELDDFTEGYIEALLWASVAGDGSSNLLDEGYTVGDINPEDLALIIKECKEFQEKNFRLLEGYAQWVYSDKSFAGHDFLLTRNHEGAGFWDREATIGDPAYFEKELKALTEVCHTYKHSHAYLGDDGHIYLE